MNNKPILHVVDMSNDFMQVDGALYVKNAELLISITNEFFSNIKYGQFEFVLATNDTHFKDEYKYSEESKYFIFHQGFGTKGHAYAVDVHTLNNRIPVYWMLKNEFDMWDKGYNSLSVDKIKFSGMREQIAYENLYHIAIIDRHGYNFLEHRDEFFTGLTTNRVAIIGVATDYCVRFAIEGYLKRGFEVTLLKDLTVGIYNQSLEDGVANFDGLVKKYFADEVKSGQLVTMKSADYLASIS